MYSERFETQRNNLTTMGNFILSSFTPIYKIIQIVVIILVPLHLEGVFGIDVKSVMEGDSVTLYTHLTEIQKADLILWTFGSDSTRIAQINRLINKISYYDGLDGRFRDRLKLDHQTGSLIITDITTQHTGLYGFLQIIDGKQVTPKKFSVTVSGDFIVKDEIKLMKTMRGQSVTLHTDVTEIEENELIWWKFADSSVNKEAEFSVIAKWDKTNNEENLCNEETFRDRLHLDHSTGSLTITNITNELCGHYKLQIISERLKISKTFSVAFYDPKKRPEIQRIGLDNRRVHSF
uniref:Uncharacterized protein n=1 Tax=Cyprinus carpio TaxID=7962 RepID=A0A8C2JBJ0_CYPCA